MQKMYPGVPFSPNTILTRSINDTDTVIYVADSSVFPDGPNLATIGTDENAETILYAQKGSGVLSGCQRGIEGVAKSWRGNDLIARNFTAYDYDALRANFDEHHQDKANPHNVTLAQVGAAASSHNHSAANITSGTLPVTRGGTGATTAASAITSLGAVPTTRTVNSKALGSDISLTASDVGAVPATRTVNSKALSGDISLTASDVGAAASSHNHSAANITSGTLPVARGGTGQTTMAATRSSMGLGNSTGALAVSYGGTGATSAASALTSLGAVPASRTINGKALTGNIILTSSDIGSVSTIKVGSVKTLSSGSAATVTASDTDDGTVLDFGIPRGYTGSTGATGATGARGKDGITYWLLTSTCVWTPPLTGTYTIYAVGKGGNGGAGLAHSSNSAYGGGGGGGGVAVRSFTAPSATTVYSSGTEWRFNITINTSSTSVVCQYENISMTANAGSNGSAYSSNSGKGGNGGTASGGSSNHQGGGGAGGNHYSNGNGAGGAGGAGAAQHRP